MKNKIIIGNMKMNMLYPDIMKYIDKLKDKKLNNVIICPTSIYIPYFLNNNINVGIQDIYMKDNGAYTGDISAVQASSIGVKYAIIGHSERRFYHNEKDKLINLKIKQAIKNNIIPILCIGENIEEQENVKVVLKKQLDNCLKNIDRDVIIAYEPRWAIGTNIVPSNNYIKDIILYIKEELKYKNKILYGGSINIENINTINKIKELDGFLVGNVSTKAEEFLNIIEVVVNQ